MVGAIRQGFKRGIYAAAVKQRSNNRRKLKLRNDLLAAATAEQDSKILADLLVDLLVDPLVDPLVDSLVDSLVDPQRAYAKVFPSLPVNTKENQPES